MILVISSPSSSTTGFCTAILLEDTLAIVLANANDARPRPLAVDNVLGRCVMGESRCERGTRSTAIV